MHFAALRANGEIGDDECHTKPAKYMIPFRHHLLYHPKDVGKGDAKRGNHLFKAFAPLGAGREEDRVPQN